MPTRKPLFKFEVTPEKVFLEAQRPKRKTILLVALGLLLIIVLFVAISEHSLRTKALELVISIIEAILTFFSVTPTEK